MSLGIRKRGVSLIWEGPLSLHPSANFIFKRKRVLVELKGRKWKSLFALGKEVNKLGAGRGRGGLVSARSSPQRPSAPPPAPTVGTKGTRPPRAPGPAVPALGFQLGAPLRLAPLEEGSRNGALSGHHGGLDAPPAYGVRRRGEGVFPR